MSEQKEDAFISPAPSDASGLSSQAKQAIDSVAAQAVAGFSQTVTTGGNISADTINATNVISGNQIFQVFMPEKTEHIRDLTSFPPDTNPEEIYQRERVVEQLSQMLMRPKTTAVALTGIGGVGKSTLAAVTFHHLEKIRLANKGMFKGESLWLMIDENVTLAEIIDPVFKTLKRPFYGHKASPANQVKQFIEALKGTDQPTLIVLDQFEAVLNPETGHAIENRPGINELLDCLNEHTCNCRILLTSRSLPKGLRFRRSNHMLEFLQNGLTPEEGAELLRLSGVEASEELLQKAVVRCDGHVLSLNLLALLLYDNDYTLDELLNNPIHEALWDVDIGRNLLDKVYETQLNPEQRQLLLAFSIFREPVPLNAVLAVLEEKPADPLQMKYLEASKLLRNQHLLQAISKGTFYLHVILVEYLKKRFQHHADAEIMASSEVAHARAARYYLREAQSKEPAKDKRRGLGDFLFQLEAAWHFCKAKEWQKAYDLMWDDKLFRDLMTFGGYVQLVELCQLLLPSAEWQPSLLQSEYIFSYMALAYEELGDKEKAHHFHLEDLRVSRASGNQKGIAVTLGDLGRFYQRTEQYEEALTHFQQALELARTVTEKHPEVECNTLSMLGDFYVQVGDYEAAREHLLLAVTIYQSQHNIRGEGRALTKLGEVYQRQRKFELSLSSLERALEIARTADDLRGIGWVLHNKGVTLLEARDYEQAHECLLEALQQRQHIGDQRGICWTLHNLGRLYIKQAQFEEAMAALLLAQLSFEQRQSQDGQKNQARLEELRSKVGEIEFNRLHREVSPNPSLIISAQLKRYLEQN